jgi:hypothetical protein
MVTRARTVKPPATTIVTLFSWLIRAQDITFRFGRSDRARYVGTLGNPPGAAGSREGEGGDLAGAKPVRPWDQAVGGRWRVGYMAKPPGKHREPWTKKDDAQLRKEAGQNTPTRVLALHLKRTVPAVRARAQELDLPLKPTNQRPYGTKKGKGR